MVLGFILYESVDLTIQMIRLVYNGTKTMYYWWYKKDQNENIELVELKELQEREQLLIKHVEILKKRIEILENNSNINACMNE